MLPAMLRTALPCLATALVVWTFGPTGAAPRQEAPAQAAAEEASLDIYYLEIVTPEMDATCEALARMHGVTFGEPQMALGNARTAQLKGGGRLGVRKPMHDAEAPTVRPYVHVDDVDAAFALAEAAGGQAMLPPMESQDGGRFSIYLHGGIQHGIWQP